MRHLAGLLAALMALAPMMPAPARADEAAVRKATAALVQAWNRHDVKAWSAFLAGDVWYREGEDFYERFKGRDKVVALVGDKVRTTDLQWEIVRVVDTRPDGIVGVVLVERLQVLPRTAGKYRMVFTSDPSYARWRKEADGRWRLVYFTSTKGVALADIKQDEQAPQTSAASAAAPAMARPKPPRGASAHEPGEYTAYYGKWAQGCNNCHGRPPGLPSSEVATRILAVGAAAADGAALRKAMQRNQAMSTMLADPLLTDAALDAVRRFLVAVRDGALPESVRFDAAGATREVELRNERSARDAPATIDLLRVSGPFVLDAERSTCRRGAPLAGQASCKVVVRAQADAGARAGSLELRFAPTPGLEPQPRRVALRVGG
jgi:hypothetical protein